MEGDGFACVRVCDAAVPKVPPTSIVLPFARSTHVWTAPFLVLHPTGSNCASYCPRLRPHCVCLGAHNSTCTPCSVQCHTRSRRLAEHPSDDVRPSSDDKTTCPALIHLCTFVTRLTPSNSRPSSHALSPFAAASRSFSSLHLFCGRMPRSTSTPPPPSSSATRRVAAGCPLPRTELHRKRSLHIHLHLTRPPPDLSV